MNFAQRKWLHDGPHLITGGTGFLGRHLARALAETGCTVVATAHRSSGADSETANRFQRRSSVDAVEVVPLELTDPYVIEQLIRDVRPAYVWHLAADTRVERSLDLLQSQLHANVVAGGRLLEAAIRTKARRIIWVGTCEEYGDGPAPFSEDQPVAPVSPYSISKAAGTLMAHSLARNLAAPIVIVRPFLTYGPGQPNRRFIAQAIFAAIRGEAFPMTLGAQTRDLVHVFDTIRGLLAAGQTPRVEGEIINLASGEEHRMADVARLIFQLAGADPDRIQFGRLPQRPGESDHFFGTTGKAERLLGWRASIRLEEGLRRTIAWHRERMEQ